VSLITVHIIQVKAIQINIFYLYPFHVDELSVSWGKCIGGLDSCTIRLKVFIGKMHLAAIEKV